MTKKTKYYPVKSIRLADTTWKQIEKFKKRDESWNSFFTRLLEAIKYFKKL